MIRIPDSKVEKAVAKDGYRNYLTAPYFTGKGIVATDGHILAYVPVVHDADQPGHIPLDAFKQARKDKCFDMAINNGEVIAGLGHPFPREDLGKFPNWEQVAEIPLEVASRDDCMVIGLDAKLLYTLTQALSTKTTGQDANFKVRLRFNKRGKHERAIHVESLTTQPDGAYGLIMPVRLTES